MDKLDDSYTDFSQEFEEDDEEKKGTFKTKGKSKFRIQAPLPSKPLNNQGKEFLFDTKSEKRFKDVISFFSDERQVVSQNVPGADGSTINQNQDTNIERHYYELLTLKKKKDTMRKKKQSLSTINRGNASPSPKRFNENLGSR